MVLSRQKAFGLVDLKPCTLDTVVASFVPSTLPQFANFRASAVGNLTDRDHVSSRSILALLPKLHAARGLRPED